MVSSSQALVSHFGQELAQQDKLPGEICSPVVAMSQILPRTPVRPKETVLSYKDCMFVFVNRPVPPLDH